MTALLLATLLAAPKAGLRELAEKAELELEAWDLAGAQKAVDEMVQAHPDSPEAAWFRGRVLFEQGRYDDAVKAYAEAGDRGATPGSFDAQGLWHGSQGFFNSLLPQPGRAVVVSARLDF